MKKNVLKVLVLCVLLVSCASSSTPVQQTQIAAQLVAQSNATNVYKFQDGMAICYFTENRSINSAGGIFCK